MRGPIGITAGLAAVLVCVTVGAALRAAGQAQVPGAFRSTVTFVPIDVRVVDRNTNKPVTDLRQEDFTVLENGVTQVIRHFSRNALTPEEPAPDARLPFRQPSTQAISSQNRRTFLIVLGRGRLGQPPERGLEAVTNFVRKQLLPQDHVAVLAYNRATDFTTDHEKVAQVLERFARAHYRIDMQMTQRFSGLAAIYGSKTIPKPIQDEIDAVFRVPGGVGSRYVPASQGAEGINRQDDARRKTDALQRSESVRARETKSPIDEATLAEDERSINDPELTFDDYVAQNAQTAQDLSSIYAGIEYLRYFEGEKRLIYMTSEGLFLPRLEDDYGLAGIANDARVVIDTVVAGIPTPKPRLENSQTLGQTPPPDMPGRSVSEMFAIGSVKNVSELTGGRLFAAMYSRAALDRINDATTFGYLLGYYPKDPAGGGYRRITVKVNRKDVIVLFRHGYYARDVLVPFDRRAFVAYSRIAAAGSYAEPVRDIDVLIEAARTETDGSNRLAVSADVTVRLPKEAFTPRDDRQMAHLDVSVFCGDPSENLVGESWQTIDLRLKPDTYARTLSEGVRYAARVTTRARARWIKVVAYNPTADIVGSAVAKVAK